MTIVRRVALVLAGLPLAARRPVHRPPEPRPGRPRRRHRHTPVPGRIVAQHRSRDHDHGRRSPSTVVPRYWVTIGNDGKVKADFRPQPAPSRPRSPPLRSGRGHLQGLDGRTLDLNAAAPTTLLRPRASRPVPRAASGVRLTTTAPPTVAGKSGGVARPNGERERPDAHRQADATRGHDDSTM
jgi:hypothetical protein